MRKDMNKIICERPRIHGGASKPFKGKLPRLGEEDLPTHISMKAAKYRKGDTKDLNENLQPLYRFVGSNVGRSWNKVYSEIRKNFNVGSTINQHIFDHLKRHVQTTNIIWEDGKVKILDDGYKSRGYVELKNSHIEFYIHPKTGILLRNTKKVSSHKKYKQTEVQLQAFHQTRVRQINANTYAIYDMQNMVWFKYVAKAIPKPVQHVVRRAGADDVVRWQTPDYVSYRLPEDVFKGITDISKYSTGKIPGFDSKTMYWGSKKQLSKTELKQYNLV